MKINDAGLQIIRDSESFSPVEYVCPAGYNTVYWGHLILPGEKFNGTREEGDAILLRDAAFAENAVSRLVRVPLSENQFSAIVSFTFNLGAGALQSSTLRMKLNRGDYFGAADEFPRWTYAGGKKLRGLFVRRQRERALFLS